MLVPNGSVVPQHAVAFGEHFAHVDGQRVLAVYLLAVLGGLDASQLFNELAPSGVEQVLYSHRSRHLTVYGESHDTVCVPGSHAA